MLAGVEKQGKYARYPKYVGASDSGCGKIGISISIIGIEREPVFSAQGDYDGETPLVSQPRSSA
jgi:hypothetical protein